MEGSAQQAAIEEAIVRSEDDVVGGFLKGWTLVAEWETQDGPRLVRLDSPTLTPWTRNGYLHAVLADS